MTAEIIVAVLGSLALVLLDRRARARAARERAWHWYRTPLPGVSTDYRRRPHVRVVDRPYDWVREQRTFVDVWAEHGVVPPLVLRRSSVDGLAEFDRARGDHHEPSVAALARGLGLNGVLVIPDDLTLNER